MLVALILNNRNAAFRIKIIQKRKPVEMTSSQLLCVYDPIKVGKLASFVGSSKDYRRYLIHEPLNLCCQTTRCIPARTCSPKTAVQHFSQDLGPKDSTSATLTLHIRIYIYKLCTMMYYVSMYLCIMLMNLSYFLILSFSQFPAYAINRLKPAPWWNQPISLLTFFGHKAHSIVANCTRAALPPPWIFCERHLSSKSSGAHEIVNACEECTASHRISPDGFKRSGCYFVQSSC